MKEKLGDQIPAHHTDRYLTKWLTGLILFLQIHDVRQVRLI